MTPELKLGALLDDTLIALRSRGRELPDYPKGSVFAEDDDTRWLQYWIGQGSFMVATEWLDWLVLTVGNETMRDVWFHVSVLFLLWLQASPAKEADASSAEEPILVCGSRSSNYKVC